MLVYSNNLSVYLFKLIPMFESILSYFESISPIMAAFYATLFTWGMTALGAAFVFFFKTMNRTLLDGMLGFTGGVMIAASYWSLLAPAIDMSTGEGVMKIVPVAIGFILGALFYLVWTNYYRIYISILSKQKV